MQNTFHYQNGALHAESVNLKDLVERYSSPTYVYSAGAIAQQYRRYQEAFGQHDHMICYAVKANGNLAILKLLADMGAGFDVVSGGELQRVLKAGGDPRKVVFSGVGKTKTEIELALSSNIYSFNVESAAELEQIERIAKTNGAVAKIAIRINPDIQAGAHPHVETGTLESKFGVSCEVAEQLCLQAANSASLELVGIDCHIGSQIADYSPIIDALKQIMTLAETLSKRDIRIEHIDIGGGLGLSHSADNPHGQCDIEGFVKAVYAQLGETSIKVIVEPGRSIVAAAGILLTEVLYLKESAGKNFAIVNTGMNHFLRPALYDAAHPIIALNESAAQQRHYDVVGTICESADVLASECALSVEAGDILAICNTGAYGSSMSSNYNGIGRAAEVMVQDKEHRLIRKRESSEDLWHNELV